MNKKLFFQALVKYLTGIIVTGLLIFLPAGTLHYLWGWVFMGILFLPMLAVGVALMVKNPVLLSRRLQAREGQKEQQWLIKISGLMFLAGFVLAGLDYRFQWLPIPQYVNIAAGVIFLGAYAMYAEVVRENTYLSRTVEIQQDQKVIDTGLYGIVRHPMYSATVLLFLAIPLVLGSVIALLPFLMYPAVIAARIRNEEKVLEQGLKGYSEYRKKVKYRLIPGIW